MIVVHAPGGGLGHLTRVLAAHHTLGWRGPVVVLSSSTRVGALPLPAEVTVRPIPRGVAAERSTLRAWLLEELRTLEPDELWVDALPGGMWGEVDGDLLDAGVGDRPVGHLARLVRWSAYASESIGEDPPRFTSTVVTERLGPAQERWLAERSDSIAAVPLVDPPASGFEPGIGDGHDGSAWLVVHAGADAEILDLVSHAQERATLERSGAAAPPPLVLCTPDPSASLLATLSPGVTIVDAVPVWPLFDGAPRVVAAAGANTVRQLLAAGAPHHLVPVERRWDDQFARARWARETALRTFPLRR